MKLKNYKSMLGASLIGASCVFGLVSCDGGSSDSVVQNAIDIPSVPNAANGEVTGTAADGTGADVALESTYITEVFDGINAERAGLGLSALTIDPQLSALAEEHNQGLLDRAVVNATPIQIDHIGAQERADAAFAEGAVGYGENIAGIRGFSVSQVSSTFVTGWVNSSDHFKNLSGDFTSTGIAVTVDERDGAIYATQIFTR